MARELQWRRRKTRQRVEREAHHLPQRILGLAGEPFLAVVRQRDLLEADPRHHPADEARLLRHCQQGVERPAAHQPEVAGVDRDFDFGRARQEAVESVRGGPLERGVAAPALAHAIDDIRLARAHHVEHRRQELGRILQVGVDDQHMIAAAQIESGGQRELVAVVARQVHGDDVRIFGGKLPHDRPAAVPRAVVDQHHFVITANRLVRGGGQASVQGLQARLFIEAGHDDRKRGHQCNR